MLNFSAAGQSPLTITEQNDQLTNCCRAGASSMHLKGGADIWGDETGAPDVRFFQTCRSSLSTKLASL